MNTLKHRQCYEIITAFDDINPFKVLDNVNASDICNRRTLDKYSYSHYDLSCVHTRLHLNNLIYVTDIQVKGVIFWSPTYNV